MTVNYLFKQRFQQKLHLTIKHFFIKILLVNDGRALSFGTHGKVLRVVISAFFSVDICRPTLFLVYPLLCYL